MTNSDYILRYFEMGMEPVFWPQVDDWKGPRQDGWQKCRTAPTDYVEGSRVGIKTGTEIAPGRFLHDIDIDWAPGEPIARKFLPVSGFTFGRHSKPVSHVFITLPVALPTTTYKDIDNTTLIELRGTKSDGEIGFQTMVPPSVWSKNGQREPLRFRQFEVPNFASDTEKVKKGTCHTGIGMILAKHLGVNGFGHEARLCWAGFLLRAGLTRDVLIDMGEGMSTPCENKEVDDVRRVVDSTIDALARTGEKVKGGPALAKLLGANGKKILARINEWLGRDSDFIRNDKNQIIAKDQRNIRRAVELLGHELSYNEFTGKPLIDGRPLEDQQANSLYLEVDAEYHIQPPESYFRMVIGDAAFKNSFHPVRDYLAALRWDGKPRLATWLVANAQAKDTPYVKAVSAIMLIAAVRRIRQPGCKYDEMVVWESEQGTNKSSAAQALCPDPAWFSDDLRLNLHSQQLIEATLGKWIIEASDLQGKRKAELEQLKAMLSRQVDGPARMAYAHFGTERPRHFIIIGTTNSEKYLPDPTGARRWWPIKVGEFNIERLKLHRDQLWAEAAFREARGGSIRLPRELWPVAAVEQEKRREIDPWEDRILLLIEERSQDRLNAIDLAKKLGDIPPSRDIKVTCEELYTAVGLFDAGRRSQKEQGRVADIMRRLKFTSGSVWVPEDRKTKAGYSGQLLKPREKPKEEEEQQEGEQTEGVGPNRADDSD